MVLQFFALTSLLFSSPQTALQASPGFDQKIAWKFLTDQCDLGPRFTGMPGHLKCRDLILAEAKKQCDSVELQPFTWKWSKTSKRLEMFNILGYQNWEKAKTRLLLIAHWDTRPSADEEAKESNRNKPILGANDGASGVAVLMELMRHTKTAPADLGICYLFVDGEDLGPGLDEMFLGATYYAKNLKGIKPDYGILLDMIGDKDLRVPIEPNSYNKARNVTLALYRHAAEIGLGKTFPMEMGPEILDDHLPINDAKIPTIDLIDFDYPSWHTLADTPDKCSPESLGKVGKLLYSWTQKSPVWSPKR
jgi:glutaminyl-peptide cyclotransferase